MLLRDHFQCLSAVPRDEHTKAMSSQDRNRALPHALIILDEKNERTVTWEAMRLSTTWLLPTALRCGTAARQFQKGPRIGRGLPLHKKCSQA